MGERPDVAGAQPAVVELDQVLGLVLRAAHVVGAGDPRAAHLELADALAVPRHLAAVRADQPGLDQRGQPALGVAVGPLVVAGRLDRRHRDRAERRHLGHAPGVPHGDVVPLLQGALQARGRGRAADDDVPDRRGVDLRVLVEIAQQIGENRWYRAAAGHPLGLDHLRQRLGLQEAVRHDHRRAGQQPGVRQPPGVGVEERHDREHPVALVQVETARQHRRQRVQEVGPVAVDDALRAAGRAGGVTHRRRGPLVEQRPVEVVRLGVEQLAVVVHLPRAATGQRRAHLVRHRAVDDDRAHRRQVLRRAWRTELRGSCRR